MRVVAGLVVGLVGCGRVDFALGSEADAAPSGSFGAPQPIAILDSTLNDADPTLTGEEKRITRARRSVEKAVQLLAGPSSLGAGLDEGP